VAPGSASEEINVWDFLGHGLYLLFQHSPAADGPECRVLGPYKVVRFGAQGIWAYGPFGEVPLRVATRAMNSPYWEIDGFDDSLWADVTVLAPDRPTSAREIEASNEGVRTR
jgi:hypothetical protein